VLKAWIGALIARLLGRGRPVGVRAETASTPSASAGPADTHIVRCAIHPGIGIARVGNSPNGYFVGPTIFDEVSPSMTIGREEIFGPVASISPVSSLDEAIALFRVLEDAFGLGWALHTRALIAINIGDATTAEPLVAEAFGLFGKAGDISAITILLDDAAQLARLDGHRHRSLRLAAAAASLQAKTGAELAEMANSLQGRPEAGASDAAETKAWDEGLAMTMEEAVAYALKPESEP